MKSSQNNKQKAMEELMLEHETNSSLKKRLNLSEPTLK
jgi:hypothetical protein